MICNRCSSYITEDEYEQDGICTECATDIFAMQDDDIFDDYEDAYLEDEDLLDWELERIDEED